MSEFIRNFRHDFYLFSISIYKDRYKILKVQQLLTLTWQCRIAICIVCIGLLGNPGTLEELYSMQLVVSNVNISALVAHQYFAKN